MEYVKVYTADNHWQHIEVLKRNRKKRSAYGRFFVEGVRAVNQMAAHNWRVYAWIYADRRRLSTWAQDILSKVPSEKHFILAPELMEQLSDKEDTSELLALVVQPDDDLARIPLSERPLLVVCDRPTSPGNLGTIMRSCDSFRVDGLIVTGHSADIYDPAAIRASVGSLFSLPTIRVASYKELLPWIEKLRTEHPDLQLVGTTARTDHNLEDCNFTRPTILFMGNETLGLSASLKELCNSLVRIPIHGTASSLNVGCAASICLYEVDRQRRMASL